jgi:hypothetical protein
MWAVRGPLAAIPWPLSGARPEYRGVGCFPTFVGWRDRLSQRIVGVAESLWERPS